MREGWGVRDSNWDMATEIQHELRQGLSLSGGWYRNTGGYYRNSDPKNRATDNVLVGPADYDTYCITAPTDTRLPGGGGYQLCGLYDVNPDKFGLTNNLVHVDHGRTEVFNGVDVALRARFGNGGLLWERAAAAHLDRQAIDARRCIGMGCHAVGCRELRAIAEVPEVG